MRPVSHSAARLVRAKRPAHRMAFIPVRTAYLQKGQPNRRNSPENPEKEARLNEFAVAAPGMRLYRLSLGLTIAAVAAWALSTVQSRFTIGFYGLIHSYPISYFVSLGLLTIASSVLWIARESHPRLLCLQLCLFIVMIWLTPILIGANPVSTNWT